VSDLLAMMHGLLPLAKHMFSVACCTRTQSLALHAQDLPCYKAAYARTCYGPATAAALALAMTHSCNAGHAGG